MSIKIVREPETERFVALVAMFRGAGVCWECRHAYAIKAVETEHNRSVTLLKPACEHAERCRERARKAYVGN